MSRFDHGFEPGQEVTIVVHMSGRINQDGGLEFHYGLDRDFNLDGVGDQQDFSNFVVDNGSSALGEWQVNANKEHIRPYGTPWQPAITPVSDDDLKDALASILGKKED